MSNSKIKIKITEIYLSNVKNVDDVKKAIKRDLKLGINLMVLLIVYIKMLRN